jgi:hypothetical protein
LDTSVKWGCSADSQHPPITLESEHYWVQNRQTDQNDKQWKTKATRHENLRLVFV